MIPKYEIQFEDATGVNRDKSITIFNTEKGWKRQLAVESDLWLIITDSKVKGNTLNNLLHLCFNSTDLE